MITKKTFGDTIKKLRERDGLTLRQVADELDIDLSMLGKIEKNNRRPTKPLIEKAAKFFKVSTEELIVDFVSDSIVDKVMYDENLADKILKVAEEKVKYLKGKRKSQS